MTRENCTVYKHSHVEIVIVLVEILWNTAVEI